MRGFQGTKPDSVKVARGLRHDHTQAEHAVWRLLRDRRLTGLKFRRQHPLGKYSVDFFCYELRLAIELDGSVHSQPSQIRKDAAKDKYLEGLGIRVLRIPNGMPLQDPEAFFKQIGRYCDPHPSRAVGHPLPKGEGGRDLLNAGQPLLKGVTTLWKTLSLWGPLGEGGDPAKRESRVRVQQERSAHFWEAGVASSQHEATAQHALRHLGA